MRPSELGLRKRYLRCEDEYVELWVGAIDAVGADLERCSSRLASVYELIWATEAVVVDVFASVNKLDALGERGALSSATSDVVDLSCDCFAAITTSNSRCESSDDGCVVSRS